jgi:hypothetical protein
MKNHLLLIAPLVLVTAPFCQAQWVLVDDMESGNNWAAGIGTNGLVADPANPANTVFFATAVNGESYRAIPEIPDDSLATLFFRVRTTANNATADWVWGSSYSATPLAFNSFEGYGRLANNTDPGLDIDIRNTPAPATPTTAAGFSQVGDAAANTWYNVWLVLNTVTNTTDLYFNTSGNATTPTTAKFFGGGFRNSAVSDSLKSFLVRNNNALTTGYIDDLYIDLSGENLSNPQFRDADNDGLEDGWEELHGFSSTDNGNTDVVNGPNGNPDADGMTNLQEFLNGTDPRNPDTDGDGLTDGAEFTGSSNLFDGKPTNPKAADSDGDGVSDFNENGTLNTQFANAPTDPNLADTDGDGLPDGYELLCNNPGTALNPNDDGTTVSAQGPSGDRDGDSLTNLSEYLATPRTRADLRDTDNDGLDDNVEDNLGFWSGAGATGTNPTVADSDGDGIPDGQENPALNAFPGLGVLPTNSDPNQYDTDNDGFGDRAELLAGTNPNDGALRPVQPAGFQLVENFEGPGMVTGQSFIGLNGWVATVPGMATVSEEPIAGGDKVGTLTRLPAQTASTSVRKALDEALLPIIEGNTGTLFLQVYCGSANSDQSLGLSDQLSPVSGDFGAFEAQTVFFPGQLHRVRDGAVARDVATYPVGRWMNVWIVADNSTDTVRVFVESPDGQTGRIEITDDGGFDPFNFRIGTVSALLQLLFITSAGAEANSFVHLDNIYIDPSAENLSTPAPAKPSPIAAPAITSVSLNGAGDLLISFTPGGAGYFLAGSISLLTPFTEETNATYDGAGTFTVPASALNPGRHFFRVEPR